MTACDRTRLINKLRSIYGISTDKELMNALNDHLMISDNCVTIDEVANADLVNAWNKAQSGEPLLR